MFTHQLLRGDARSAVCAAVLARVWSSAAAAVPERQSISLDELLARLQTNAGGDLSGSYWIDSPGITVAQDARFLTFAHFIQSEQGYDGGNLKYSLNGAALTVVPATAFTHNGHNGEFEAAAPIGQNTNPLAGEPAWTGSDQGEATGSWSRTVVDLAKLDAAAGDTLVFRWEFGNDGCSGNLGWYVDDGRFGGALGGLLPPLLGARCAEGGSPKRRPDRSGRRSCGSTGRIAPAFRRAASPAVRSI